MKRVLLIAVLLVSACSHAKPPAADGFRNEVIADIAWNNLAPHTQDQVERLLSEGTGKSGPASFEAQATWADSIRDSDRPTGSNYAHYRAWHWINIPLNAAGSYQQALAAEAPLCPYPRLAGLASAGPAEDCIVDKIEQFETELSNPATTASEKVLALKYLIHLVGDVHEPMQTIDDNDRGGSCVFVTTPDGLTATLQGYWSINLPRLTTNGATPRTAAATLDAEISHAEKADWHAFDPAGWAAESANVGRSNAYDMDVGARPTCEHRNVKAPIPLSSAYQARAVEATKLQLKKAGIRLADVLNNALP